MEKKIKILVFLCGLLVAINPMYSQVTIGMNKAPEKFSVLELASNNKMGLRLPQIETTAQRDAIFTNAEGFKSNDLVYGLQIFNKETNCVEYWNGDKWVSLCLGTANITLTGDNCVYDPFALIPASGEQPHCTYTPVEDPVCVVPNGHAYTVIATGTAYAKLTVDEVTSAFSLVFSENLSHSERSAIVRVINNCSGEFKEFIFTQAGAECPSNAAPFTLQNNTTEICGLNGAAIVYIQNPQEGINYMWEHGGVIANTGNYMEITRPGDYTVYAGLIGCPTPTPQKITVTQNDNTSLSMPVVQATNSGVLCNGGNVILTATNVSENVKWFHNGALYNGTHTNPLNLSGPEAAGEWFAVQQSGTCSSRMSNIVILTDHTDSSVALDPPVATVNGTPLSGNPVVCKGGTLELIVTNSYPAGTIFEWFDNGVSINRGTEPIIYMVAPNKTSMVLSVQVSNSSGGCPNTTISNPINVTFTAPAPTTINNGASTAAICGNTPAVLHALNASGMSYEWYRNGVAVPSATTDTYYTTQPGIYTLRYQDSNGCWSPISTGITVIQSAAVSLQWQVEPGGTATVSTQKSYSVFASPAPDRYIWSSSNTAVATVTPIGNGSAVSINYLSLGTTTITITAENACGTVSLQKEIEVVSGCTPITSVTITPNTTVTKVLDQNGLPKTPGDATTFYATFATNGSAATSYEWYVNGVLQQGQSSSTFTFNTPTGNASKNTIYAAALNACTGSNTAKSASVIVNVTKENPVDVSGNYRLNGKTCFDVARSNDGSECMPLVSRIDDFASTKSFTYTFFNSTSFSDLTFEVEDNNGLIASTSATGNTFTITFRNDINDVAAGKNKISALKFTVIAKFTDNTSAGKQVMLDVFVQDCSCGCAVKSSLSAGWLTFLCYNLGVPESTKTMTLEQQMKTSSPTGDNVSDNTIYGNLYQWGRKGDGHEKRNSPVYPSGAAVAITNLDADGQVALSDAIGKFVKAPNNNFYDWRKPQDGNLWYNNGKTASDHCPAGWRIPTKAEWGSIFKGGTTSDAPDKATVNKWTWTNTGTPGYKISPDGGTSYTLFLPAAGERYFTDGKLMLAGTQGYYWSSTASNNYSYLLFISNNNVNPNNELSRTYGFSVRCIEDK